MVFSCNPLGRALLLGLGCYSPYMGCCPLNFGDRYVDRLDHAYSFWPYRPKTSKTPPPVPLEELEELGLEEEEEEKKEEEES